MHVPEHHLATFAVSDASDSRVVRDMLQEHFPNLSVESRYRFRLASRFVDIVQQDMKTTTIRYSPNAVEYPATSELPVFKVDDEGQAEIGFVGTVLVTGLCYKAFGCLDDIDAKRDGFSSAQELRQELQHFYGEIDDAAIVSIFAITHPAAASSNR